MDTLQLIDRDWLPALETAAAQCREQLRIVCPFVTQRALQHLLEPTPGRCRLITRFSLADWAAGVSDPLALQWLIERGGEIRGVRDLHTKLYVFDGEAAILGSANLTWAALTSNHELGARMKDGRIVQQCTDYFDALWNRLDRNLTTERLETWLEQLRNCYPITRSDYPAAPPGLRRRRLPTCTPAGRSRSISARAESVRQFTIFRPRDVGQNAGIGNPPHNPRYPDPRGDRAVRLPLGLLVPERPTTQQRTHR
jgi:hypothetical protein